MKRRTVPHQGLVARIGAGGVASVSWAPRAMSGAITRVRRKRKASSISEDPAAGRSIPEKPRSGASIGAPSASSRSIAWSSLRYGANQHSIGKGPDGAMPPGQWRYLPVGEKF